MNAFAASTQIEAALREQYSAANKDPRLFGAYASAHMSMLLAEFAVGNSKLARLQLKGLIQRGATLQASALTAKSDCITPSTNPTGATHEHP